jgi:hypothetical protein
MEEDVPPTVMLNPSGAMRILPLRERDWVRVVWKAARAEGLVD